MTESKKCRECGEDIYWHMKIPQMFKVIALMMSVALVFQIQAAIFSDANWSNFGLALQGGDYGIDPDDNEPAVFAIAVAGSDLYLGGSFTNANGIFALNIVKWDGSSWSDLGSGLDDGVLALAVSGNNLYAGGSFTRAGGIPATGGIARWDGTNWSALGSAFVWDPSLQFSTIRALAVSGTNLYAGGLFTNVGGVAANNIAKWNGSSWSALGSGVDGSVYAITTSGTNLYVGGSFSQAGESPARGIAKWDGTSWSPLGSGLGSSNLVRALAVAGEDVYAGGSTVGTNWNDSLRLDPFIAKWNGSTWSALGSGLTMGSRDYGYVGALASSGNDLYVTGHFSLPGSIADDNIVKWNGSNWSALGSGLSGNAGNGWALAASGSDLYVGGVFRMAGGKAARSMAHAYLERPTLSAVQTGPNLKLSWPLFYEDFTLQQNSNAANSNAWSNANIPTTTNGASKNVVVPLTSTNRFFRLIGI